MSKPHRGKSVRTLKAHGRGVCPVCKREAVKVIYEQEIEGQKAMICKVCKATLANKK